MQREMSKQRIAKLRLHHSSLIGVKLSDKNETYNGLKINGPSVHDEKPKKKKKVAEDEDKKSGSEDSDDNEIINAVYQL